MKWVVMLLLAMLVASPTFAAIEKMNDATAVTTVTSGDQQRFTTHSWDRVTVCGRFTAASTAGGSLRVGIYQSFDGETWKALHYAAADTSISIAYVTGVNTFWFRPSQDYYITNSTFAQTPILSCGMLKFVFTNVSGSTLSNFVAYAVHN